MAAIAATGKRSDQSNVVAVAEVPRDQVSQYGIVGVGEERGNGFRITSMVEKPKPAEAPSTYMISGRYILQPEIFGLIENQAAGAGGEIQITDAMLSLARRQDFFGYRFEGRIFDCGSKIGFLTANVAYALEHEELGEAIRREIEGLLR